MLKTLQLLIVVSIITLGCATVEYAAFSKVEGGTLFGGIAILGALGMVVAFFAVLVEVHHECTKDTDDDS